METLFNGQVLQDKFVTSVLNNKQNGFFLEIGSNEPKIINNTYVLEHFLNWRGIMVEYNVDYLPKYERERSNSIHLINDATKIDYHSLFLENNVPKNIDYLQIDLEVSNRSTLTTLELLEKTIFPSYNFATVTFEHDIYSGNYFNTRGISREIFDKHGYVLVFPDVRNGENAFEDWYVHPSLVDMNYINKVQRSNSLEYIDIMKILDSSK
jgi:hypothetical protein